MQFHALSYCLGFLSAICIALFLVPNKKEHEPTSGGIGAEYPQCKEDWHDSYYRKQWLEAHEQLTSMTIRAIELNRENWVLHGQLEVLKAK